jgi:methionine biosynthesis protein MetW
MPTDLLPLDLERTGYAYIERPNTVLLSLLKDRVLSARPAARILDIGCGAGANARALKQKHPKVKLFGIEPNARAAELAKGAGVEVFQGTVDDWLASKPSDRVDAVVLSDVLEHISDPVSLLRRLISFENTANATFVISVPNYAVWYNRLRTLVGRFDYAWSGLYDRTHLRFFTRKSLQKLLRYLGLVPVEVRCTPSLLQSAAPLLRRFFENDVAVGEHLALTESTSFKVYRTVVEPLETQVCSVWPELLGFQIVLAAHRA